mgnify:CR=1 FL=1
MNKFEQPPGNPESNNKEQIKDYFLKDFSDEEIDPVWTQIEKLTDSLQGRVKAILHRSIQRHDYVVNFGHKEGVRMLEFQLTGEDKLAIAHLVFNEEDENPGHWELPHRFVHSDEIAITGTEFLNQSENYLRKLAEKGYISLEEIHAFVSQPTVASWLQKNGYEIANEEDKRSFDDYQDNPDDYEEIYVFDDRLKYGRDPFLFKSSDIDSDQMTQFIDPGYSDGRHLNVHHGIFLKMKGLVRIKLEKKFNFDDKDNVAKKE